MTLRIRSDSDDKESYETSMRQYREHLGKACQEKVLCGDLLKYFYQDFFHDGKIGEIVFRNGTAEVLMTIDCPNIKRKIKNGSFEYINIPFICVFKNVLYFKFLRTVEDDEIEHYGDIGQFTFICSEINTLPELNMVQIKNSDLGNKSSLIIEVLPDYACSSSYIEIVFKEVVVEAAENAAFQMMLASSEFEVPIYDENGNP